MSMSLFGSILGNMDEDPFFGSAMRHMTSVDHMMSSMIQDPFGMNSLLRDFGPSRSSVHSLMPTFGMPMMPSFGRVLGGSMGAIGSPMGNCNFSSSSTVISMTSGPDGRPQVYKATSSTKVAPGGIKETQRTVTDSVSGTKKMEIGHHIGDRAHIIEKEQNMHTGDREEREDFINLDEEEAEDFNKEWATKTRSVSSDLPRLTAAPARNRQFGAHTFNSVPAITAGYSRCGSTDPICTMPLVSARRSIRPHKLSHSAIPGYNRSSQRTPYRVPGSHRKSKNVKIVSGPNNDKSA